MAELPRDTIYHYESKDGLSITVTMTPLVRCKDCKYSVFEQWVDALDIYTCYRTSSAMAGEHCRATDFCSRGERKSEVEE